ncbi:helix-turn-helix domain-containing protein [Faecalimonas sp.]
MDVLKVKVLICFHNEKEQWNVTNLAITLGVEKYAVSRILSTLEKEGLLDKSDRRKPILTRKGKAKANEYSQKVEMIINHLLEKGISQEVAREDAATIVAYCKEETLEALKKEEVTKRVKFSFREGMEFDGDYLSGRYPDGNYPIPFTIFQKELKLEREISIWNEEFVDPCVLNVQNKNGKVFLQMLTEHRQYRFQYWDGREWRDMERQGRLLSFKANYVRFQSMADGKGRILFGKIWIQIYHGNEKETLLFTMYIA